MWKKEPSFNHVISLEANEAPRLGTAAVGRPVIIRFSVLMFIVKTKVFYKCKTKQGLTKTIKLTLTSVYNLSNLNTHKILDLKEPQPQREETLLLVHFS